LEKDRNTKREQHNQANQKYRDAVKACEAAIIARDSGRTQNLQAKQMAKLEKAVSDSVKALELADASYQKTVAALKAIQEQYERDIVTFMQTMEDLENLRLASLRDQLTKFGQQHEFMRGVLDQVIAAFNQTLSEVNCAQDVQEFIKATTTGAQHEAHVQYLPESNPTVDRVRSGSPAVQLASPSISEAKIPSTPSSANSPSAFSQAAANQDQYAQALYAFESAERDDLPFEAGAVIRLTHSPENEDWWQGELDGRNGMFPKAYVQRIEVQPGAEAVSPVENESAAGGGSSSTMNSRCVTLYDFEGTEEDELSFVTGETLIITGELNGWYIGMSEDGTRKGILPQAYVQLC